MSWYRKSISRLQHFGRRPWYPVAIGILAGIDHWLVVIPTDGLVVAGVLLNPKKWISFACSVTVFSTLGSLSFAWVVGHLGPPFIEANWSEMLSSQVWLWTTKYFGEYGLYVVFAVAMTPLAQQPAMIAAALAKIPMENLAAVVFSGRAIKYATLCLVTSKAPQLLKRVWGIQGELKDAKEQPSE